MTNHTTGDFSFLRFFSFVEGYLQLKTNPKTRYFGRTTAPTGVFRCYERRCLIRRLQDQLRGLDQSDTYWPLSTNHLEVRGHRIAEKQVRQQGSEGYREQTCGTPGNGMLFFSRARSSRISRGGGCVKVFFTRACTAYTRAHVRQKYEKRSNFPLIEKKKKKDNHENFVDIRSRTGKDEKVFIWMLFNRQFNKKKKKKIEREAKIIFAERK